MGRLRESTLPQHATVAFRRLGAGTPFSKIVIRAFAPIEHVVNQAAVIRSSRLSHGAQATTDRTFVKKRSRHEWH